MTVYVYRGQFSARLKRHVLRNAPKFQETMRASVEAFGGKLDKCYLTAAGGDPIGFVSFEQDTDARAWALFYGMQKGVQTSQINALLDTDALEAVAKRIDEAGEAATKHRG